MNLLASTEPLIGTVRLFAVAEVLTAGPSPLNVTIVRPLETIEVGPAKPYWQAAGVEPTGRVGTRVREPAPRVMPPRRSSSYQQQDAVDSIGTLNCPPFTRAASAAGVRTTLSICDQQIYEVFRYVLAAHE